MKTKLLTLPLVLMLASCASDVDNAKKTVMSAKIGMDAFVHLERDNGAVIKTQLPAQYKAIHNYSNVVRRNGQQWLRTADSLIDSYATNKTDATKSEMDKAIAILTTVAAQSIYYVNQINAVVQPNPTPAPSPVVTPAPTP